MYATVDFESYPDVMHLQCMALNKCPTVHLQDVCILTSLSYRALVHCSRSVEVVHKYSDILESPHLKHVLWICKLRTSAR